MSQTSIALTERTKVVDHNSVIYSVPEVILNDH